MSVVYMSMAHLHPKSVRQVFLHPTLRKHGIRLQAYPLPVSLICLATDPTCTTAAASQALMGWPHPCQSNRQPSGHPHQPELALYYLSTRQSAQLVQSMASRACQKKK
jgi:hypothetical protein